MQQLSNFLTDEYYNPRKLRLTKIKINEIFSAKIFHNMKKLYRILFLGGGGGGGQFSGGQFSWGAFFQGVYFRGVIFWGAFFPGAFFLAPNSAIALWEIDFQNFCYLKNRNHEILAFETTKHAELLAFILMK